ncbi:hypothetical protein A3F55_01335 [Candidatus Adlerbacteria bacterium RIFCSPHIGHO2_12_FULL_53_18]|uniref:Phosphoglycerate kinase n=2 Tax=Parcubacteria group TaxID=1794811 RepID=A0A1F4XTF5_9BACT|nr:MAG: hypothetical protein A3F55_01335 [Candidatus Adlerbacteria bacterium RIFCSPHIGHO2_12_FULL_53_18]OGG51191.1 MAG: hypothetical protein A2704_03940 [Candidatus Kaiserbacteria bacterium RIFCSPHIGHO2_01_FULL_54_36b]
MELRSVRDADVAGKRVLVRVNFDTPTKNGAITDGTRLRDVIPTLELLRKREASKIILLTHVGRPGGKMVEALRVALQEQALHQLTKVPFEVLENLRFDPREEANDQIFAKELGSLGDVFVNEAFSVSHRTQASVVGITKFLPSYAGLRFEEEIQKLSEALTPPKGALAIIGGAKFETKQPLIEKLLSSYSKVLLGGALGNDVIKARGLSVGASLVSNVPVPTAIASEARLEIATDTVVSERDKHVERTALTNDIRAVEAIVDIGPNTARAWAEEITGASFVLWNGPMGIYEDGHTRGTDALAEALAGSPAKAVVGGGDTVAAISKFSFDSARVFISTGGGAMLEFLTKGTLPGIEPLKK